MNQPKMKIDKDAAPPDAQAVSGDTVVPDSRGRKLTIREPSVLDESRLARLMGDSSTNMGYMLGYVTPAASHRASRPEQLSLPLSLVAEEVSVVEVLACLGA